MTGAGANGESELLAQVLAELSEPLLSRGSGWSVTTRATPHLPTLGFCGCWPWAQAGGVGGVGCWQSEVPTATGVISTHGGAWVLGACADGGVGSWSRPQGPRCPRALSRVPAVLQPRAPASPHTASAWPGRGGICHPCSWQEAGNRRGQWSFHGAFASHLLP